MTQHSGDKSGEHSLEEPREFDVSVRWNIEQNHGEAMVKGQPPIRVGRPPENLTPEHLVVAAVTTCFVNSFVYFTKKMHIEFKSIVADGTGVLERVGRSFEITRITVRATAVISEEDLRHRMERALELGAKYCFVGNSLKSKPEYSFQVIVEGSG